MGTRTPNYYAIDFDLAVLHGTEDADARAQSLLPNAIISDAFPPQKPTVDGCTHQHVDGERHHDDGDQQIGQRQRHNEVVGDGLQGALPIHGQNDQHIAE